MAKIIPFKAVRPIRDKVHLVATRPVYSYKKHVLKAKLEDNPFTFLHIINPEFDKTEKTKANSKARFKLVKRKFDFFLNSGILIKDRKSSFYIYRQTKDNKQYTGIICGASVEEYNQDLIKKHEATLTSREQMFTEYLEVTGFNAEPVLLSYQGNNKIEELIQKYTSKRSEYEFTTTDRIKHELWRVKRTKKLQKAFEAVSALYIADGHHRSASSSALAAKYNFKDHCKNYFLAYLIDENKLTILEFNRLIKSLNGFTKDEFLSKLTQNFEVKEIPGASKPTREHQFTMCLLGTWYELNWIGNTSVLDAVNNLDAEILTQNILKPILNIQDLKTDQNIAFVSGAENLENQENKIKGNIRNIKDAKFEILFVLYPATMDQVKKVADNNLIMPPKSTWVEPKMRSGLTIYELEE